jgi:hypothetical protein
MSTLPEKPPVESADPRAFTGLIISAIGIVGWLIVLATILGMPKEPYTTDGQRNFLIAMNNGLSYLIQVMVGVTGLLINGTLSLIGTLVSAAGRSRDPQRFSTWGIGLGVAGMLIGMVLVIWRLAAWNAL